MTLTSGIPVLRVGDYARARAFWRDILGFTVLEEAGDPTGFGIYRRDAARVFLEAYHGPEAPHKRWRAYFHTDDLDGLIDDLVSKQAIFSGPVTTEYGMREVEVADPDGNVLCFGMDAA